ncbi:MAG: amidohydrolase [Acidobacteriia bacterium]|nr:amidohydrolase [Terriglobia bacterium]
MKRTLTFFVVVITLVVLLAVARSTQASSTVASVSTDEFPKDLHDFAALDPIDAHVHLFNTDPAFVALLKSLRLHVVNIIVVDDKDGFEPGLPFRLRLGWSVVRVSEGHALMCTSFDPFKFQEPTFAADAIRQMNQDFADGAIAVKIWKNVGMELKNREGRWVMPDDPVFEPIYKNIAAHDKTLIAHLAEPDGCWQPPDTPYLNCKNHPNWYMYGRKDAVSKATILAARDHLLEQNPKLRVVGAHLGSMETDVAEIAKRFDRYPNFAVDTAARVRFLALQPRDKVRAFFLKYQDRILYGTDLDAFPNDMPVDGILKWQQTLLKEWRFFATDETQEFQDRQVKGLKLPEPVLRKLYHDNAVRWIPGSNGQH